MKTTSSTAAIVVPYGNIDVMDVGGKKRLKVSLSAGRTSGEILIYFTPAQAERLAEELRS